MAKNFYITEDGERMYFMDSETFDAFLLGVGEDGTLTKKAVDAGSIPGSAYACHDIKSDEDALAALKKAAE